MDPMTYISSIFNRKKKVKARSNERPRRESKESSIVQPDDLRRERLGLILLYDGRGLGTVERNGVDIVAVHGLHGHPISSFIDSTGCFWLRDLLPGDIPECRVFSYGYDAMSLSTPTISMLSRDFLYDLRRKLDETESSRPLVFIGHNLGGLLVKSLLVQATLEDGKYREIFETTAGVLFFGTPHRRKFFRRLG